MAEVLSPEEMLKKASEIAKKIEEAKKREVVVGLPKGVTGTYKNGVSVLTVAMYHEYGGGHLPQRSFLRSTAKREKKNIEKIFKNAFGQVITGDKKAEYALEIAGVHMLNEIQNTFQTANHGKWLPLRNATIKEKGSSAILQDTRTLVNSITYKVRKSDD